MTRTKMKKNRSLFEYEEMVEELTKKKNRLVRLNQIIDWELFRPSLERDFPRRQKDQEVHRITIMCSCLRC